MFPGAPAPRWTRSRGRRWSADGWLSVEGAVCAVVVVVVLEGLPPDSAVWTALVGTLATIAATVAITTHLTRSPLTTAMQTTG